MPWQSVVAQGWQDVRLLYSDALEAAVTDKTIMQSTEADREERNRRMFHDRCEHFIRHWGPEDLRDSADFSAELMMLFRDLQINQAQAYGEIVAREMSLRPIFPFNTRTESPK